MPRLDQFSRCQACAVRSIAVCNVLDNDELERLASITGQHTAANRETIIYEGDPAEHLFNVTRGAIKLYKLLGDGRRQITGFLFPGDFLGLALHDRYAYSAEAIGPTQLCRFPRAKLERLLGELPKLERRLLQTASNELASAQDQMLLLGRKSARERIATFLLTLSARAVRRGVDSEIVDLPMSRSDIGDYLGLTIETVSRTFTILKRDGLIELPEVHRVRLTNRRGLAEIAGLDDEEDFAGSAFAAGY